MDTMLKLSNTEDADIAYKATENLCKWCHLALEYDWRALLLQLLFALFNPATAKNPMKKACLSHFFPLFASKSRSNQLVLRMYW